MSLFNKQDYSDITLTINDGIESITIPAHRSILANRSDFFDRLFRYPRSAASAANEEKVSIKDYQIFIAEYGTLEECLEIIEHSIYGTRPISYDQIQYQTNLVNYLLIGGKAHLKKHLITTRFIISSASLSKRSVLLSVPGSRDSNILFVNQECYISPALCNNIEFLEYLASLIPELIDQFSNPRNMELIQMQGLLITKLSDIQKLIQSLYTMNLIQDNNFPYSNILSKVIFHQGYSVMDPIYIRTKELASIHINIKDAGHGIYVKISIVNKSRMWLLIWIQINTDNIIIHLLINHVDVNDHPEFFLIIEWIRIFFDLDLDLEKLSNITGLTRDQLLTIPTDIEKHLQNRQKVCAMFSYLNIAGLFPRLKKLDDFTTRIKQTCQNDLGLIFDNEYQS